MCEGGAGRFWKAGQRWTGTGEESGVGVGEDRSVGIGVSPGATLAQPSRCLGGATKSALVAVVLPALTENPSPESWGGGG